MRLKDMHNEVAIEISSNNLINGIVHDVFGNTWGGTVLNNHPFGYGVVRKRNNTLVYEGFYCDIMRVPING